MVEPISDSDFCCGLIQSFTSCLSFLINNKFVTIISYPLSTLYYRGYFLDSVPAYDIVRENSVQGTVKHTSDSYSPVSGFEIIF